MKILKYILLITILFLVTRIFAQPDAPKNLKAETVTYNEFNTVVVHLTWDKVKDSKGLNIPLYEIFKKEGGVESSNEFKSLGNVYIQSMKRDMDVVEGNTYTYYVVAKDFDNNVSAPSEMVEITVSSEPVGGGSAKISGKVIDSTTNSPLEDINVVLVSTSSLTVQFTKTDAEGNYTAEVYPGEYIVYFRAMQDYFPQFYNNAANVWEATRISINDDESIENINASLEFMGSVEKYAISGNVQDESGNPLMARIDVFVSKSEYKGGSHFHTLTDTNGDYSVEVSKGLEVVVYAHALDGNYYGEFYNDTYNKEEAERLLVSENISGIDFVLGALEGANSSIAGNVVNSASEEVASVVMAIKLGEPRKGRDANKRVISDDGSFVFKNLLPGKYILFVAPDDGYLPTFYTEDGKQTNVWQEADTLTLLENADLSDINIVVSKVPEVPSNGLAQLGGMVNDDDGNAVADVFVSVFNSNNELVQYTFSDLDGRYNVGNLVPGFYTISCSNYGMSSEQESDVYVGIDSLVNTNFVLIPTSPVGVKSDVLINEYQLLQNYPNPFNPSTTINFSVKKEGNVQIKVYNVLGSEIATILNKKLSNGNYNVMFNANNLPSGIYIYQLKAGATTLSKKMMLMK